MRDMIHGGTDIPADENSGVEDPFIEFNRYFERPPVSQDRFPDVIALWAVSV